MPVGKGRTGAVPVPGGEMPGRWCGRRAACRSLFPKESGLIWVQNPSSYVAMSRKVPPQAVTSRRRGGNRGVRHLVTNFSTEGPGRGIADCGGSLPKGHRQHCRTGICTGYVSNASVLTLSVFRGRGLKTPKTGRWLGFLRNYTYICALYTPGVTPVRRARRRWE